MAGHSINPRHYNQLQNTSIISTKPTYIDHNIREAIVLELHNENMNGEDGPYPETSHLLLERV
jgi:hypothetical protein